MTSDAPGALLLPAVPPPQRRESDRTRFLWPVYGVLVLLAAEGVEDDLCLGLLTGLRCDLVQGYVISKPKPADQLDLARHELPALTPRRAA